MGTVLITGCTPGGIGHALALEFSSRGYQVIGTVRSQEAASILLAAGITAIQLEVTSEESIQRLHAEVKERTNGNLSILVNNVGVSHTVPALDLKLEDVRNVFEVNLFSTMRMVQLFAPLLISAQGKIVNIGSQAGVVPYVFGGCYNASKAALHSYTDALRIEMAPFKVQVVLVVTGGVKSKISDAKKRLPPNSLYLSMEEGYLLRQGNSQTTAMPTETYAREVVGDLLNPSTKRWLWRGHRSSLVRWLSWVMPLAFWDYYFSRKFGLRKFRT
ncbi:NAD(P)-binding protein [Periconia macrospinosa]|uniref:NAD(P)-binding protein n=1 Tax=Periconia macrospinosa TaxID=97972 RepID=A0A2V1DG55_9PLEO|nr:NAD(P)-binding protein [Periconia macrospinosa]